MNNFINNINELLSSCITEISQFKKITVNMKINAIDRELIIKYAIPIFYSNWEGFFVKSLIEYINFINSLVLGLDEVKDEILAHCLNDKYDIGISRNDFEQLKKHALDIRYFFQQSYFSLNSRISTKSNLSYKVANGVLDRLCLNNLPIIRQNELNKLLLFRNNIAHGECTVPCDNDIINEMSNIVINCMYDLFLIIEEGINNELFKKH